MKLATCSTDLLFFGKLLIYGSPLSFAHKVSLSSLQVFIYFENIVSSNKSFATVKS